MLRASCVLTLATLAGPLFAQSCSQFSFSIPNQVSSGMQSAKDWQQHTGAITFTNEHYVDMKMDANCTYSDQAYTSECYVTCHTSLDPVLNTTFEQGTVTKGLQHKPGVTLVTGNNSSNGTSISCGAQVIGGILTCLAINPSCALTVSTSGSSHGFGGNVSYSSTPLWSRPLNDSVTCSARIRPTRSCPFATYPAPYVPTGSNYSYVWDTTACQWRHCTIGPGCPATPIIIDTDGSGFHLTSAEAGVQFDFYGTGRPMQIAWTEAGSKTGWLVLPDKDGQVPSAANMFSSMAPQFDVKAQPPNGFAAMALYDAPAYGGNDNGTLDPHDTIWGKLRVWLDTNHNGKVDPGELQTLDEIGIAKIDLRYSHSEFVDAHGNQFRFKGRLAPINDNEDIDRKIFDVFLMTQ